MARGTGKRQHAVRKRLRLELEQARVRLAEAQQALDAIRHADVEAVPANGREGSSVYRLAEADYTYRVLVEAMSAAAATLTDDGTIAFCNTRFAQLLDEPPERVMGRSVLHYLPESSHRAFAALMRVPDQSQKLELRSPTGETIPAVLSVGTLPRDTQRLALITTDLRAHERKQEIVAAECLAHCVLDQTTEAIIVCDDRGVVVRANGPAVELAGQDPLGLLFERAYRVLLALPEGDALHPETVRPALGDDRLRTAPGVLQRADGSEANVLVSMSPLGSQEHMILGTVITLVDVTERLRHEAAEARAARELAALRALHAAEVERKNRELEGLSSSVAHDLRTPLRSIAGFSAALLEDYGDRLDAEGKRQVGKIQAAAERMAHIIDALLGLARIGRATLERTPVDLSALARAIAGELQQSDPQRRVTWAIPDGLHVNADGKLVRVLLESLLHNAWKFTCRSPGAHIELSATERDGVMQYSVRDNGAGFNMEFADKLFKPFHRLHDAAQFSGTGVGLATVQRIVERHGGRCWAHATPGGGAVFHFVLEATNADAPADERQARAARQRSS